MATAAGDKNPAQSKHGRRESVREGIVLWQRKRKYTMEARPNNAAGPTGDPIVLLGVIAGDSAFPWQTKHPPLFAIIAKSLSVVIHQSNCVTVAIIDLMSTAIIYFRADSTHIGGATKRQAVQVCQWVCQDLQRHRQVRELSQSLLAWQAGQTRGGDRLKRRPPLSQWQSHLCKDRPGDYMYVLELSTMITYISWFNREHTGAGHAMRRISAYMYM